MWFVLIPPPPYCDDKMERIFTTYKAFRRRADDIEKQVEREKGGDERERDGERGRKGEKGVRTGRSHPMWNGARRDKSWPPPGPVPEQPAKRVREATFPQRLQRIHFFGTVYTRISCVCLLWKGGEGRHGRVHTGKDGLPCGQRGIGTAAKDLHTYRLVVFEGILSCGLRSGVY